MRDVSLLLDEDVRVLLAEVLRSRGYSATHVLEVDRGGKSDEDQFEYAIRRKMTIVTHNVKDFVRMVKGKHHYGIIVSSQIPFNDLLRRILHLLSMSTSESLTDKVVWLSDYK